MKLRTFIYGLLALAFYAPSYAQDDAMLASMQQRFGLYTERAVQEKMYVHIDRPFYLVGETIWFKAYNLNGATHRFLDLSKVGYLEVLDSENNAVLQTKFSMVDGRGNGSALVPSTLVSGKYKLRCYTNWMKNFTADSFFETSISILNPFVRFDPDRASKEETRYDVQFFPEGGHLVSGIESKVAFRAAGVDGKGIRFKGVVLNQQNETVREFEPELNGIGYFTLKPEGNTTYKAAITDSKGKRFEYELPKVEPQGYVMEVKDSTATLVKVTVTARLENDGPVNVYMLTHTRQANALFGKKPVINGKTVFVLERATLGEGITQITIFNEKLRPVCERLYFKRPEKQLNIDAQLGNSFITREKVTMNVTAGAGQALPAWSNLSVAVFLDDSIRYEQQQDIHGYLWLTADLKGNVENPAYYFQNVSKDTDRQLDNLMLTHGWRRLAWDKVFGGQLVGFEHLPEYDGHFIHARVLNREDGTPAKNKDAFLSSLDVPARLYVDKSDDNGRVKFEVRQFTGPKEITLQTDLAMDSTYRFEVANPFSKQFSTTPIPSFFFDKTLENSLLTRSINMQTANAYLPRVYAEKKAMLTDSLPFFGMPDEKYFLDDFTRFPTMEEVLREYVKGVLVRKRQKEFHLRMIDKLLPSTYYTTDPLMLLDGIPVFDADKIIEMDPLKVKKIELLSSRYFLGPMTFTGIVSFSTYRGDLGGFELDPKVLVMPYEGVQAQREFYAPKYDSNNASSRMPDFRNLMHWAPNVTTGKDGKALVEFYTSDQTGHYQVVIQGITADGIAGSKTLSFDVKKRTL
jgi:hypothetical protein